MCVKAAICILSFIQLVPKLIPCIWSIFTDFQNEIFSSNLKGAGLSADLNISKSALLSLKHHNFSNTEPIYRK